MSLFNVSYRLVSYLPGSFPGNCLFPDSGPCASSLLQSTCMGYLQADNDFIFSLYDSFELISEALCIVKQDYLPPRPRCPYKNLKLIPPFGKRRTHQHHNIPLKPFGLEHGGITYPVVLN